MTPFALSQVLGGIAVLSDAISFQFRSRRAVLFCIFTSGVLITAHYWLLNNQPAATTYGLLAARTFVALWFPSKRMMWIIVVFFIVVAILQVNSMQELAPFVGGILNTFASFQSNDFRLRVYFSIGTIFLILTAILAGSPSAIIMESLFLGSNLIGLFRFYRAPRS